MKVINLGGCAHNDDGLDFSGTPLNQHWWNYYLAWLASTPRNWIERRLEPPAQEQGSHLRFIDIETPEEAGVQNGYPTDDLQAWWLIVCMDGAPERMHHQMRSCQKSLTDACLFLAPAERRFYLVVSAELFRDPSKLVAQVIGDWRDGVIVGCDHRSFAREAVIRISQTFASINFNEGLPWNWQFHVRAGLGQTVRAAFSGILSAKRDQLVVVSDSFEYVPLS